MSDELMQTDVKRIEPKNGHILVKPPAKEKQTKGGIYLPESQKAASHTQGEVISWDPDIDNRKFKLQVGTKVIFNKFSYTEIRVPAKDADSKDTILLMIESKNIQGVIA